MPGRTGRAGEMPAGWGPGRAGALEPNEGTCAPEALDRHLGVTRREGPTLGTLLGRGKGPCQALSQLGHCPSPAWNNHAGMMDIGVAHSLVGPSGHCRVLSSHSRPGELPVVMNHKVPRHRPASFLGTELLWVRCAPKMVHLPICCLLLTPAPGIGPRAHGDLCTNLETGGLPRGTGESQQAEGEGEAVQEGRGACKRAQRQESEGPQGPCVVRAGGVGWDTRQVAGEPPLVDHSTAGA
ncbi:uncharacterized protein LOC115830882 [Nomascus leucogenys]|uniref:uncharacterized protein LOC115830882 n=1 Tax=Nomascus leucogenys TaxID=61853 RepID=UPI00122D6254|nr:uncharacterized protein LOC115830882 [Nomascus leucogenys]